MKGRFSHRTIASTKGTRRGAADRAWCRGRRLVLVDIENVVGGGCRTSASAAWARRRLEDVLGLQPGDQLVIGVDGSGLFCAADAWPGARMVVGRGPDGADRALLEVMAESLSSRYDHVILASGDGIFTEPVAQLTAQGLDVTVVAHETGLSRRLAMAASRVVHLSGRRAPVPPSAGSASSLSA